MKTASPRISKKSERFYTMNFETINFGVEYVVEAFPAMFTKLGEGIVGQFTRAEVECLEDALSGTWLIPRRAGKNLHSALAEAIEVDKIDETYGVNGKLLINKIAGMHIFDIMMLEILLKNRETDKKRRGRIGRKRLP
jgi:hypothetical protein